MIWAPHKTNKPLSESLAVSKASQQPGYCRAPLEIKSFMPWLVLCVLHLFGKFSSCQPGVLQDFPLSDPERALKLLLVLGRAGQGHSWQPPLERLWPQWMEQRAYDQNAFRFQYEFWISRRIIGKTAAESPSTSCTSTHFKNEKLPFHQTDIKLACQALQIKCVSPLCLIPFSFSWYSSIFSFSL